MDYIYEPGSPDDPERFDRGFYRSGRERHDLIKSVRTLTDYCARYKAERDEARLEVALLRARLDEHAVMGTR